MLLTMLCILLHLAAGTGRADDITFAVGHFEPFHYRENDEPAGMVIEIVREICKRNGLAPHFTFFPWKRALKEAENGHVDGIIAVYKTKEREAYLVYPASHMVQNSVTVFGQLDQAYLRNDESAIHRMNLLRIRGTSYSPGVEEHLLDFLLVTEVRDIESQLTLLLTRPGFVAVGNELVINTTARKMGVDGHLTILNRIEQQPLYVAFSRTRGVKADAYARLFSSELDAMRSDGSLNRLTKTRQ